MLSFFDSCILQLGTLDIEDNGMMHYAVYDSGSDNGVAKIIARSLKSMFEVRSVEPLQ